MRDIKEIEYWISKLENEESSFQNYAKLADLYAIRDKMVDVPQPKPETAAYAGAGFQVSKRLVQYGDSEFLQSVAGKDPAEAWLVMDELMDTLAVVNPKAYESIIRKLNRL